MAIKWTPINDDEDKKKKKKSTSSSVSSQSVSIKDSTISYTPFDTPAKKPSQVAMEQNKEQQQASQQQEPEKKGFFNTIGNVINTVKNALQKKETPEVKVGEKVFNKQEWINSTVSKTSARDSAKLEIEANNQLINKIDRTKYLAKTWQEQLKSGIEPEVSPEDKKTIEDVYRMTGIDTKYGLKKLTSGTGNFITDLMLKATGSEVTPLDSEKEKLLIANNYYQRIIDGREGGNSFSDKVFSFKDLFVIPESQKEYSAPITGKLKKSFQTLTSGGKLDDVKVFGKKIFKPSELDTRLAEAETAQQQFEQVPVGVQRARDLRETISYSEEFILANFINKGGKGKSVLTNTFLTGLGRTIDDFAEKTKNDKLVVPTANGFEMAQQENGQSVGVAVLSATANSLAQNTIEVFAGDLVDKAGGKVTQLFRKPLSKAFSKVVPLDKFSGVLKDSKVFSFVGKFLSSSGAKAMAFVQSFPAEVTEEILGKWSDQMSVGEKPSLSFDEFKDIATGVAIAQLAFGAGNFVGNKREKPEITQEDVDKLAPVVKEKLQEVVIDKDDITNEDVDNVVNILKEEIESDKVSVQDLTTEGVKVLTGADLIKSDIAKLQEKKQTEVAPVQKVMKGDLDIKQFTEEEKVAVQQVASELQNVIDLGARKRVVGGVDEEGNRVVSVEGMAFPDWIPEEFRKRSLLEKALETISKEETAPEGTKLWKLQQVILDQGKNTELSDSARAYLEEQRSQKSVVKEDVLTNDQVVEYFKSLGTDDGNGNIVDVPDDDYIVETIRHNFGEFVKRKIGISDIIEKNIDIKKALQENPDAYIREREDISEESLYSPIILSDKGEVLDGYGRLNELYNRGETDIEVYQAVENVAEKKQKEEYERLFPKSDQDNPLDDLPFRIAPNGTQSLDTENIKDEGIRKVISERLKQLSLVQFGDENVEIVEKLITPDGKKAWGKYHNAWIQIANGSVTNMEETFYHEAVHKALDLFFTKEEKTKILNQAIKLYGRDNLEKKWGNKTLKEKFRIASYQSNVIDTYQQNTKIVESVGFGVDEVGKRAGINNTEMLSRLSTELGINPDKLWGSTVQVKNLDTGLKSIYFVEGLEDSVHAVSLIDDTLSGMGHETLGNQVWNITALKQADLENPNAIIEGVFDPSQLPYSKDETIRAREREYRKQFGITLGKEKYKAEDQTVDNIYAMAEEQLAEDMIKYANNQKTFKGKIKNLFDYVTDKIKSVLKGEESIVGFYRDLYNGNLLKKNYNPEYLVGDKPSVIARWREEAGKSSELSDDVKEIVGNFNTPEEMEKEFMVLYHGGRNTILGGKLVTGGQVVGDVTNENLGKGQDMGGIFFTPDEDFASIFQKYSSEGSGKVHTFLVQTSNMFDVRNPKHYQLLKDFVGKKYKDVDGYVNEFTQQKLDFMVNDGVMDWATFDSDVIQAVGRFNGVVVMENGDWDGKPLYTYALFDGGKYSPHYLLTDDVKSIKDLFTKVQNTQDTEKYNYRSIYPNVRGGWTKDKILAQLKLWSSFYSPSGKVMDREIRRFDSPEDLMNNIYYHGSGGSIGKLKPSVAIKGFDENSGGGGYGEKYWGISLSKDRNMASRFTGQSRSGNVAMVLLRKGANVVEMPEIEDSVELEDHIEDLWNRGVDAVKIGKWDSEFSEQEIVILNPRAVVTGKSESFPVYQKPKMPSFTLEQVTKMYKKAFESTPSPKYRLAEDIPSDPDTFLEQTTSIKLPELLTLAENISGNKTEVTDRMKKYLGVFRSMEGEGGYIRLKRSLFKPKTEQVLDATTGKVTEVVTETEEERRARVEQIEKVMAHELGHMADFYGGEGNLTTKRGNLLGRIASLRGFMETEFRGYENKDMRKELKNLTQVWKPFTPVKGDKYTKYRFKANELYADAVSVLLNKPELLKQLAPNFYNGFVEFLERKPEVRENLFAIYDMIKEGREIDNRLNNMDEGFKKAQERRMTIAEREEKRKLVKGWEDIRKNFAYALVSEYDPFLSKMKKLMKEKGISLSKYEEAQQVLENLKYIGNKSKRYADDVQDNFITPITEAGIDINTVGQILILERNLGDRIDLANPQGLVYDYAKETYDKVKEKLGVQKWMILEEKLKWLRERNFEIVTEGYKNGMFSSDFYNNIAQVNKNTYTPFAVVKYITDNYVTAGVIQAKGTLSEVENPLVTSLLKSVSIIKATETNKAKAYVVNDLIELFKEDILRAKAIRGEDGRFVKWEDNPVAKEKNMEVIEIMVDGKKAGFYVDPYIHGMFEGKNGIGWNVGRVLVYPFRMFNKIFKPLVTTLKPSFALYSNIMRDTERTGTNLAVLLSVLDNRSNIGKKLIGYRAGFLKMWMRSLKSSWKFADDQLDATTKEMIDNLAIDYTKKYDPLTETEDMLVFDPVKKKIYGRETSTDLSDWIKSGAEHIPVLNKIITPVYDFFMRIGGTLEVNTKIAGYQYLRSMGVDEKKSAFYTRKYVGTPDYKQGGRFTEFSNVAIPFSNIAIQALKADSQLALNPTTASGWWMQKFLTVGIPKLLMLLGVAFLKYDDDGEEKSMYDLLSEYTKVNYLVFPLGMRDGKVVAFKIPQDETSRLLGAVIWKMGTYLQGKGMKVEQLASLSGGIAPFLTGENPLWKITTDWFDYAQGRNPYDDFRGREAIATSKWDEGGIIRFAEMMKYTSNSVGLTWFKTYDDGTKDGFEKVMSAPVLERMFEVTDYGLKERANWEEDMGKTAKKQDRRKLMGEYMKDPTDKNLLETTKKYIEQVIGKSTPEEGWKGTEAQKATTARKDFKRFILENSGKDEYKNISASSLDNAEKMDYVNLFYKRMDDKEFSDYVSTLVKYEVVSTDLYVEIANSKKLSSETSYQVVKSAIPFLTKDQSDGLLVGLRRGDLLSNEDLNRLKDDGILKSAGYLKYIQINRVKYENEQKQKKTSNTTEKSYF